MIDFMNLDSFTNGQQDASMQKHKPKQVEVLIGVFFYEKWTKDEQKHLVPNHSTNILLYHISITPFKPINYTSGINEQPNTLLRIEEKLLLSFEQPGITVLPALQRLGLRIPDSFMAILWNSGDHTTTSRETLPTVPQKC